MSDDRTVRLADLVSLPVQERRSVLRELVSRSRRTDGLRSEVASAVSVGPSGSQKLADDWQGRVLDRLRDDEDAIERERQAAQELVAKLLVLPSARRDTLVLNSRKFHTWSVCHLLSKESLRALFRDPQSGLDLARLATAIAEGPYLVAANEALLNDLKAISWSYRGNAHRAVSQFAEAEAAFAKASAFLREGTGDPIDLGRLTDFKAGLRMKQRRLAEAEQLYDRAIRVFLSIGDRHTAGMSMVGKAVVVLEKGAVEDSMKLNRQALEMIDAERDPRLHAITRHNLAVALKTMGAFPEAAQEIRKLKAAHSALGDTITLLRLSYVEAEVEFGLGLTEQAITRLSGVRDAFAEHGMAVDVAFATLDLAAYHLQLNQLAETKRLASESLPIFRTLGIHREAIAAFLVFQEAAEREAATVELVREIATYLRASRTNPELKFRS